MGKGGLACAAPFPMSCAPIWAQDSGCFFYNRSDQQNFKITKFIVDYCSVARRSGLKVRFAFGSHSHKLQFVEAPTNIKGCVKFIEISESFELCPNLSLLCEGGVLVCSHYSAIFSRLCCECVLIKIATPIL